MSISTEEKDRYLRETAIVLAREGFQTGKTDTGKLRVLLDGAPLLSLIHILLRPSPYLSALYLRAALISPSLASAPLLAKNTLSRPVRWQSFWASWAQGWV